MSAQPVTDTDTGKDKSLKRVLVAGWLGTTVEYYDFFIYGMAAALVFPKIFFPELGAAAGVTASFATFAVAFVARPLGGILFGYIGDRTGRKTTLVATLVLMGVATVAIGLLPPGSAIGIWAPILLIVFRFAQGLAVGGEWASAALFVGEYAPKDKRAIYALSPTLGTCSGLLLATLTFLVTGFFMSTETFESWGWRVPFLFSVVLVGVGLYVRLGIAETPIFREAMARADKIQAAKMPLVELFRHQWREVLLAAGSTMMWMAFFYLGAVYLTNYGTTTLGFSRNAMLAVNLVGVVFNIIATVIGAVLADKVGRRTVMGWTNGAAVIWAFCLFPLVDTGNIYLVGVATSVTLILVGLACGPTTALLPETFRTAYRSTGTGVSFNLGAVAAGAIPPILAAPILAAHGSVGLSAMMAIIAVLATIAVLLLKETVGTGLHEAGMRPVSGVANAGNKGTADAIVER
ncbi:MHS family MFS transporter [Luteimonas sp. BDR2-5]|uniref:MFS transporter n=1 Tax=Proluteimonas luteida TaxID=2878685 RepID=UPI001E31BC07|nr:MFS transporter [Luteimonas sp. BDR2-5]MCD9027975.1 MHS family MFS transporter [Luteimonas sp. BDR2-5]